MLGQLVVSQASVQASVDEDIDIEVPEEYQDFPGEGAGGGLQSE